MNKLLSFRLFFCFLIVSMVQISPAATDILEFRAFFMSYHSAGAVGASADGQSPRAHLKQPDDKVDTHGHSPWNSALWICRQTKQTKSN